MNAIGHWKSHNAGVVNDDNHDGERAEEIEARLPFAILKARIDSGSE
jgi:hypothetical protein